MLKPFWHKAFFGWLWFFFFSHLRKTPADTKKHTGWNVNTCRDLAESHGIAAVLRLGQGTKTNPLQAQVGLMWCLGPVLTSAEEWVIPAASWRVSLPTRTHEILSTTAGSYLQLGWLFCVTQYSRWSNAREWRCLRSIWEVILWPCNCKALGTEGQMETRHLFGPSSLHLPATYATWSDPAAALPANFR